MISTKKRRSDNMKWVKKKNKIAAQEAAAAAELSLIHI